MAPYGYQITKQVSWHGKQEQFSNIYHYDSGTVIESEAGFLTLLNAIKNEEKALLDNSVQFVQGRAFGPTNGTPAQNQMRAVVDWTDYATNITGAAPAPEMAVVADVYVGRGPAGRKQFLRKFFHMARLPGVSAGGLALAGQQALPAASKQPVIDMMNRLKTVNVGANPNDICTPSGKHLPLGSTWTVNDFVHTRQFRRGRKRKKRLV